MGMWLCGIGTVIEGHRREWMRLWSNGRSVDRGTRKLGIWLWSIEKGVETGSTHWECGYGVLRRE